MRRRRRGRRVRLSGRGELWCHAFKYDFVEFLPDFLRSAWRVKAATVPVDKNQSTETRETFEGCDENWRTVGARSEYQAFDEWEALTVAIHEHRQAADVALHIGLRMVSFQRQIG